MDKIKEYAAVCTIGSVGYSALEMLWRGFTHWTMGVAGGLGFLLLYLTNLHMAGKTLLHRCLIGSAILTLLEFVAGCVVNLVFQLQVWDYSARQGNILGQVCPLYTILWFLLCMPVMPLSTAVRRRITQGVARRKGGGDAQTARLPDSIAP